jgi:type IV secretory pathway VirB10-like protein
MKARTAPRAALATGLVVLLAAVSVYTTGCVAEDPRPSPKAEVIVEPTPPPAPITVVETTQPRSEPLVPKNDAPAGEIGGPKAPPAPAPRVVGVREPPPPPPTEKTVDRTGSGFVWVSGYWRHDGRAYSWVPGFWTRPPRNNSVWIAARWECRDGNWVLIDGHWGTGR